jgi:hypothetical protein
MNTPRISLQQAPSSSSPRRRFIAIYALLGGIAAALITAVVALALTTGTGSLAARPQSPSLTHPAGRTAVSASRHAPVPKLSGFAASFQDYATAARNGFGGPELVVRDCVEGGDGTAFCAYTVQGACHGAMLTEQPITIRQAGNIGLPAAKCTARHALKWIGANG